MYALRAIGKLKAKEALPDVVKMLNDPDPDRVISALDCLENIGDSSVIPDIKRMTNSPNRGVRGVAQGVLGIMTREK